MNPLSTITALFGGKIGDVFSGVRELIGAFVADPAARLQATEKLAGMEYDFRAAMLKADTDFVTQQAATVQAEIRSDSWLARNWRPILMLSFNFIIIWNYCVVPMFHRAPVLVPGEMWTLLEIGIGGYIGARSVEKISPVVVGAIAGKKDGAA